MDAEVSFGRWLEKRRKALDLTREELAKKIGCSASALRKVESDERRPSKQLAQLLANALDIPADERPMFIRIARRELSLERLKSQLVLPDLSQLQPSQPLSNSIPIPPSPLIGRESELTALRQMLGDPQCRLITLVGPGGIGKTRLAIEVGIDRKSDHSYGAVFVPLASVNSSSLILPAIADALRFTFHSAADPKMQLLNYLRDKQVLMILDNMEHLLDGTGILSEILESAPSARLLCSSREPLNLRREWIFEIGGLIVPEQGSVGEIENYSATALFAQSARRANAGFVLTPEDWSAVVRICELLEGMPLGIELAAAWVRVLSCQEVVQEIERSLDFLTSSVRDLPERHRSLRAVFDHSWILLSEAEQRSLSGLSVFRGGFTLEAAEQVAGTSLSLLSALVTKSLVHRAGEGRYDLHLLVRQYAEFKLVQADEMRQAHSAHYLALLQRQQQWLHSARLFEAKSSLAMESANIREAWRWVVQHSDFRRIRESAFSLIDMYDWLYWYPEGEQMFAQTVLSLQAQSSAATAQGERGEHARALGAALLGKDVFSFRMGQPHRARDLFFESLDLFQEAGDIEAQSDNLQWLGNMMYKRGDYTAAIRFLRQGLVLHEKRNDLWAQAGTRNLLGVVNLHIGQYADARGFLEEALENFRRCGNPTMVMIVLINLGRVFRLQNEYHRARVLLEESFALSQDLGDRWSIGTSMDFLGQLALEQGHYDEAQQKFEQALKEFRDIGDWWSRLRIMINLGRTEQAQDNLAGARQIFLDVLRLAQRAGFVPRMLEALVSLAAVWIQTSWQERAIETLAFVRVHNMTPQETRSQAERLYAELAVQLTPEQIAAVQARAQAKTIGTMVQEILEVA